MSAPVLVTGAPGNVGTPLVRELVRAGAIVRVAAWDVQDAEIVFAELPGVEVVRLDLTDPATFDVFEGVERMFLLHPPAIADVKHVIAPALDGARDRGVRHVVFLSIQGPSATGSCPIGRSRSTCAERPDLDLRAGGLLHAEPLDHARRRHP